jgi:hypothetical protein
VVVVIGKNAAASKLTGRRATEKRRGHPTPIHTSPVIFTGEAAGRTAAGGEGSAIQDGPAPRRRNLSDCAKRSEASIIEIEYGKTIRVLFS